MAKLPEQHPEIHQHFKEDLHVIRRSHRCWSELSPDLVIGQCLMRSLKTTGGLTRGGGSLKPSAFCGVCQCQHVRKLTAPCSNSLM